MKIGDTIKFRLKQKNDRGVREGVVKFVYKDGRAKVKVDWDFPDQILVVYPDEILTTNPL
jgi:hypothetical protein